MGDAPLEGNRTRTKADLDIMRRVRGIGLGTGSLGYVLVRFRSTMPKSFRLLAGYPVWPTTIHS